MLSRAGVPAFPLSDRVSTVLPKDSGPASGACSKRAGPRALSAQLRHRPSLGVADHAVDLGVRPMPPADLGDCRNHHPPFKLPLTIWFWAAYLMATYSNGISARRCPTTRPAACIASLPATSRRAPPPGPRDGSLAPAPRCRSRSACHRQDRRPCRLALGSSHLRQPQSPGPGRLSRPAPAHLQSYLDEFVICFNRRQIRHAGFRSLSPSPPATHHSPATC